jgi:hypothetical protein
MDLLAVALIAIRGEMADRRNLPDLVAEGSMAVGALDLVIRHMFPVKNLRGIFYGKKFRFVMTFEALPLGNVAVSLNDAHVALLTRYPSFNILPVIEVPALNFDISLRFDMTGRATSYGT